MKGDSIEDYQKSSSSLPLLLSSHWSKKYENLKKQRHQNPHVHPHHQHRHQQIFYNRDKELYYQETRPKNLHSIPILSSESDLKYNNKKHKNITKNNINRQWQNIQLDDNDKNYDDEEDENKNDENEDNDSWLDELGDYDENNEMKNEKINNQYKKKVPYKTYDEIIKVLTSNEPKNQNLSKLGTSVKRGSRNIENKKYQKNNTLEILYNDSIIINSSNNNSNNNKTINLNNTSIIDNQDKKKTRNIINNQLSQKINFDGKKLNSTTQLQPAITKSLDTKNDNNDDNYEKDDIDDDDDDDDNYTDGKTIVVSFFFI
ncbi:hypothetical protein HCN44_005132 [Aphidius gifuensis]|uniref:Uncharacterized protein n=1 Tax=Aphidius gifuensis TaxID=684658 RepID=A0A834XSS5_APHGI|nr:hypothetical protein HCN44_005132 [Aphidius gifuensis]